MRAGFCFDLDKTMPLKAPLLAHRCQFSKRRYGASAEVAVDLSVIHCPCGNSISSLKVLCRLFPYFKFRCAGRTVQTRAG